MPKPKEIYFYTSIYPASVQTLMQQIDEVMGKPATVRTLTPGGSVFAAYGMYTKTKEHGNITLLIDGAAMSGGAFWPLYAKHTRVLNVSRILFHRADMFVDNEEDQKFLDDINKDLLALMKMKINGDKWKAVTGITMEDLFDPKTRKDIIITGAQALEMGLVQEVVELTPEMEKELHAVSAKFSVGASADLSPTPTPESEKKTSNKINHDNRKIKSGAPGSAR